MTQTDSHAAAGQAVETPEAEASSSGAAKPKKEVLSRDYIVLSLRKPSAPDEEVYERVPGTFHATSDRNAVKDAMEKLGVKEGSFRAVAKGSWHEHNRTVATEEVARWS